ncbi:hypothetical protein NYO98_05665 [Nocardioides sp. STR2]|uniref:Roadblock/LAMTOR2 domain-containing protein n=1 Tax=Nocardioides pini TaxID=2975053 RepID=A0ABT4C9X3_9ACTN|nr:hypothetical protein [Nocardioides pini]MCY4725760.1 hypothetical protein [Nocardioides pini]
MTADLVTPHPLARGCSWTGRASRRGREPLLEHTPGPDSPIGCLWASLVDVLGAIDGPSSALLATADGDAVAVHGLAQGDVARVARQSRAAFAARAPGGPDPEQAVDTVELTLGLRHTVIASVPAPEHGRHLLTVTAQGVSVQVLEAWTRRLADDIHLALSATA